MTNNLLLFSERTYTGTPINDLVFVLFAIMVILIGVHTLAYTLNIHIPGAAKQIGKQCTVQTVHTTLAYTLNIHVPGAAKQIGNQFTVHIVHILAYTLNIYIPGAAKQIGKQCTELKTLEWDLNPDYL